MKKVIICIVALTVGHSLPNSFAQQADVITTGAGTTLVKSPTKKLGLHGASPSAQRAGSAQAAIGSQTGYTTVASLKTLFVTGSNGAGAVTATGLAVGDTVKAVINLTDVADSKADFEATVTVINQIQQSSASNYSAKKFLVIAAANSTTDVAALKTLTNELRAAATEKGMIKGGP